MINHAILLYIFASCAVYFDFVYNLEIITGILLRFLKTKITIKFLNMFLGSDNNNKKMFLSYTDIPFTKNLTLNFLFLAHKK